ncbi:hypothetical protein ACQ7CX_05945 [Chryseobacterium arthrosphaerae]|uniref:hypothetical protein n=1 Tax=Chryseobacterium arthrosphaerae TaxID=651561 RepID=UPI001BB0937D|nr:hypothetical protein [Chryseobacterium arthrosphaerae]QUY56977.1 hypothetical protein I2F65_06500 [Chryseobacterium arthrosphaerae]
MKHGAISHLQVLKIWGDEGKIIKGRRRICRDTLRNFLNRLCPISIVMTEPQPKMLAQYGMRKRIIGRPTVFYAYERTFRQQMKAKPVILEAANTRNQKPDFLNTVNIMLIRRLSIKRVTSKS